MVLIRFYSTLTLVLISVSPFLSLNSSLALGGIIVHRFQSMSQTKSLNLDQVRIIVHTFLS